MPGASSQALSVSPAVVIRRQRRLPVAGEILVSPGDEVAMDQTVARALVPGDFHPVNGAAMLTLSPSALFDALCVKVGDRIVKGQPLAKARSLFGFMTRTLPSPIDGRVEAFSKVTGQLMLREADSAVDLHAYLPGRVVSSEPNTSLEIEALVSQVQGIFGLGGERFGTLFSVEDAADISRKALAIPPNLEGKILFTRGRVTYKALSEMMKKGVTGIIAASAHGQDLMRLTSRSLNPAATGDENLGLTLVLTEGFGDIEMSDASFDILSKLTGKKVAVSGVTQIRAGVIRPEVISEPLAKTPSPVTIKNRIDIGDKVRIVRGDDFGQIGTIEGIPKDLATVGSGAKALVFELGLAGGRRVIVPRPNVELIAG
jgi:hypothetical protein